MKKILLFASATIFSVNLFAQECEEFKTHYLSINTTFFPGHVIDEEDSIFNANKAFVDYVIENLLENPTDSCFISNRNLLNQLNTTSCDSSAIVIEDTLAGGQFCKIKVTVREFEVKKRTIQYNFDSSRTEKNDNQASHLVQNKFPKKCIDLIEIKIDEEELIIPNGAYMSLFDPIMDAGKGFTRQIEAYESLNGGCIYIYVYGGNAAGTYFAKLVFDHKEYKTKIISDYYSLSKHSSFRKSFVGF